MAVTGELTLSGKLRLIGGVKEKMRPVRMGQLRRAIFPRENEAAIEKLELSESERAEQVRHGQSYHSAHMPSIICPLSVR